jgi:hypothetical protein
MTIREATGTLDEGADYEKKEGGLRVLTPAGIKKVATALQPKQDDEWQPGDGATEPNTAIVRRRYQNTKILGCEIEGKEGVFNVCVRDEANYRNGERFAVKINDRGQYEATNHRIAPKYR